MTEKEAIRQEIDALDQELLALLNRRQTLAQTIGRIKNKEGRGTLDFQREEEVLAHLMHLNPGPLSQAALRHIFREIISAAREVQIPFGVAFLGPEATFSHLAALKKFGRATRYGPLTTIQEVFSEVEKGKYQYGVVPIENSTEGIVNVSLDLFADTSVKICGELYLEVSHDLVNKSGQRADIEVIYTHPQPYAQCRGWLSAHLPEIPIIEVASTGVAAQKAAKNPNAAAIASSFAAPLYDLRVVESRIEDQPGNVTHFFVIGPDAPGPTGRDKTAILFAVDNIPGALVQNPEAPGGPGPQHDSHRLPAGQKRELALSFLRGPGRPPDRPRGGRGPGGSQRTSAPTSSCWARSPGPQGWRISVDGFIFFVIFGSFVTGGGRPCRARHYTTSFGAGTESLTGECRELPMPDHRKPQTENRKPSCASASRWWRPTPTAPGPNISGPPARACGPNCAWIFLSSPT